MWWSLPSARRVYTVQLVCPSSSTVVNYFQFKSCNFIDLATNTCRLYEDRQQITTFIPPYTYSCQCSSRFITYYSPPFVFLCLVDGLIVPLAQLLCGELYKFAVKNDKHWSKYLGMLVPRLLRIDLLDDNKFGNVEKDELHPLVYTLQLFLNNFIYLGLLMTFGAVFPPLAFSFFVTICLMNRYAMFKVDRFLYFAKEKN